MYIRKRNSCCRSQTIDILHSILRKPDTKTEREREERRHKATPNSAPRNFIVQLYIHTRHARDSSSLPEKKHTRIRETKHRRRVAAATAGAGGQDIWRKRKRRAKDSNTAQRRRHAALIIEGVERVERPEKLMRKGLRPRVPVYTILFSELRARNFSEGKNAWLWWQQRRENCVFNSTPSSSSSSFYSGIPRRLLRACCFSFFFTRAQEIKGRECVYPYGRF